SPRSRRGSRSSSARRDSSTRAPRSGWQSRSGSLRSPWRERVTHASSAWASRARWWPWPRTSVSDYWSFCSRSRSCTDAGSASRPESLEEHSVAEAAIAHRDLVAAQLVEHDADDARAGEDHLGPLRLQPDDVAPLVGRALAVESDLAIDFRPFEDR